MGSNPDKLNNEKITMGHARALSKLKNVEYCLSLFNRILKEKLTVRDLEQIIRNDKSPIKIINKNRLVVLKNMFRNNFSDLNVKVKKDKVVITFKDDEELNRFIEYMKED